MFRRLLPMLLALLALAAPARADDIAVAGRSVVRVVVIAFDEQQQVSDFGHGSGFAIAPNRIITNAHVVQMAQDSKDVAIGVVPSQGQQATRARVVAIDPARDLALLEIERGTLPPVTLYTGPLDDGAQVAALGYPGNVDLATARSAEDYITPLPPTRSIGIFSNLRQINGISTLLHTASIARGHSGGPLLDQCGRVLGVNSLITRNQEGDATFGFAVANSELVAFLQQAHQPFQSVTTECVSMSDRLRQDQERADADARARDAAAATHAEQAREARERSLAEVEDMRDNRLAVAILCLALSLVAFGAAGIMLQKEKMKLVKIFGGVGGALLLLAIIAFLSRPSLAAAEENPDGNQMGNGAATASADRYVGSNLCHFVPDRSRVTVSPTNDVPLDWTDTGCMNGRTQYARSGDVWSRILVPNGEQTVSVLEFHPGDGEYVVTRYALDADTMAHIRALRRDVDVKACTPNDDTRTILADQQRDIGAALPHLPNERLVYTCEHEGAPPAR